jgi:predicted peroxiredoxin
MADTQKMVFIVTHGPDNPEMAITPFVMAGAASSADITVVMGFQGEGVRIAKKGVAETIAASKVMPLSELLNTIREFGGTFLVASPAIKSRGISEQDLIEGAQVVNASRFVAEIMSATNALIY